MYGQYDEDGSGCLEREEVVALLQVRVQVCAGMSEGQAFVRTARVYLLCAQRRLGGICCCHSSLWHRKQRQQQHDRQHLYV